MRLQIIATRQPLSEDINYSLSTLLHEELAKKDVLTLTDVAPDVVHVFGDWDKKTVDAVCEIHRKAIPIIYTSLKGLQVVSIESEDGNAIIVKQNRRKILQTVDTVHVCGEKEKQTIEKYYRKASTKLIQNSAFTSLTDSETMINQMLSLYETTAKCHDEKIRTKISARVEKQNCGDKNINEILNQMLYIKYLMLRGGITQTLLDTLSMTMTRLQYDEDLMTTIVERMKLLDFSSSLLSVLEQKAGLTEGFMPFKAMNNKLTKRIENNILTN